MTMTVFDLIIAILSLLAIVTFYLERKKKKQVKQKVFVGVLLLKYIQQLVALIQKHRGLSNAILLGELQLNQDLVLVQRQIDSLLKDSKSDALSRFEQWHSFIDHWPRLKQNINSSSLNHIRLMSEHSALIETQFFLLDELAHDYELDTIKLDDISHMLGLCLDTLRTAETIAKARGIGVGICSSSVKLGADTIKLNFLKENLVFTCNHLFSELTLINNPSLSRQFKHSTEQVRQSITELLAVVEQQVLNPQGSISPQIYFKLASKPIVDLMAIYNVLLDYSAAEYGTR